MIKKILAISAIFVGSLSTALAGTFYFGPGITYADLHNDGLRYNGFNGTLYIGYGGWVQECAYLAAEIFGMTKTFNTKNTDEISKLLKTGSNYGVSLVPAVNIEDSFVGYLRLGYIKTRFSNLGTTKSAYQIGAGVELPLKDLWTVRVEYTYTPYHSVDDIGSVYSNQGTVALIYRIDPLIVGAGIFG